MTKLVSVLGSTGSVGTQSLEIIKHLGLTVTSLAANGSNLTLLEAQAREFKPRLIAVFDEKAAGELKIRLSDTSIKVVSGTEGIIEAAADNSDTVITAMSGARGLIPTMTAIEKGKRIALANKETLVCAGTIVMAAAAKYNAEIVPVDSEHSAIFQCLNGQSKALSRILLLATGGPFLGKSRAELENVKKESALKHPSWNMGRKISIDSATLMNKGLEFIEAMHLFAAPPEKIKVLVHPEIIIHSMVEFIDGSVLAQCGLTDMKLPIQYALTYPERKPSLTAPPDFTKAPLTFLEPDLETFPCLKIAMEAAKTGGTAPAIMNAANEEAVSLFLQDKISFYGIYEMVAKAIDKIEITQCAGLEDILSADRQARELVRKA